MERYFGTNSLLKSFYYELKNIGVCFANIILGLPNELVEKQANTITNNKLENKIYRSYYFNKKGEEIYSNRSVFTKRDYFDNKWIPKDACKGYIVETVLKENSIENCVGVVLGYEEGNYPIKIDFSSTIHKISYGNILNNCILVSAVQQELIRLGYLFEDEEQEGVYGHNTRKAIEDFQRDNGLEVNGIVEKETYYWLVKSRKRYK